MLERYTDGVHSPAARVVDAVWSARVKTYQMFGQAAVFCPTQGLGITRVREGARALRADHAALALALLAFPSCFDHVRGPEVLPIFGGEVET